MVKKAKTQPAALSPLAKQIRASKIVVTPVTDLLPYARNSRKHEDWQVAKIAGSIKEFGFTNPILIDEEGTIVAGHARVLAAMKLDLEEVPCIVLSHLTATQRKAYVIADNQLALLSGWDYDMLKVELDDLKLENFDINLLGLPSLDFDSDVPPPDPPGGSHTDGIEAVIKVKCDQDIKQRVKEAIREAVAEFDGVTVEA